MTKINSLEKARNKLEQTLSTETENKEISVLQLEKKNQKKIKLKNKINEINADIKILQKRLDATIDWNMAYYKVFLDSLMQELLWGEHSNRLCEVTGLYATNIFNSIGLRLTEQLPLTAYEKENIQTKKYELGRDWFPLAGSLGNDAQALPAGSRTPYISSLALLMAQLLPLGVLAISRNVNGKIKSYLVCLQFNVPEVNVLFVKSIYEKIIARANVASEKKKLKTIGTEKGSKSVAMFLLDKFEQLKDAQEFHNIDNLHLNVWMFSNFGTGADCDYFEVPNPSIQFLQVAAKNHYNEIKGMLIREVQKRYRYSLMEAIERKTDYEPLYPYTGTKDLSVDMKRRIGKLLDLEVEEDESKSLLEVEVEGEKPSQDQKTKKPKKKSFIKLLEKKLKSFKQDEQRVKEIQNLIIEIEELQSRPASKELFSFYQTSVVGVNPNALIIAERIALYLKQKLSGNKNANCY